MSGAVCISVCVSVCVVCIRLFLGVIKSKVFWGIFCVCGCVCVNVLAWSVYGYYFICNCVYGEKVLHSAILVTQ